MRIVILGWGSLIWDPGKLAMRGTWHDDGPLLPVEFARISRDGRLTLVLYPGVPTVPVFWAESTALTIDEARENLRIREGQTQLENIGVAPTRAASGRPTDEHSQTIERWRRRQGFDGVVWTALPANFEDHTERPLTAEDAIRYLLDLPTAQRRAAEEYIRRAPASIQTPLRQAIQHRLGWRA